MTTLLELLNATQSRLAAARVDTSHLDAELLLCGGLGLSREGLWREPERTVTFDEAARIGRMVQRRETREPLAYILGEREFWSLPFHVTPDVLVPRPETEMLLENLLERIPLSFRRNRWTVLDMCTGSGVLAVAAARELPQSDVVGTDISPAALSVARRNAERNGVAERVTWLESDGFLGLEASSLPRGGFDFILSNPPYLTPSELEGLQPEIRNFEPVAALDGGPDGLVFYPMLAAGALNWLKPGGWLLMEIGLEQGAAVQDLLQSTGGFEAVEVYRDYSGRDRVTVARKCEGTDSHG